MTETQIINDLEKVLKDKSDIEKKKIFGNLYISYLKKCKKNKASAVVE